MPKGKIKSLVSPWSDIIIARNGVDLTLIPLENNRGEGKFPGLTGENISKVTLDVFASWTDNGKDKAPVEPTGEAATPEAKAKYAEELKTFNLYCALKFNQRIADYFNTEIRQVWRDAAEELGFIASKQDTLTDVEKKQLTDSFTGAINDLLNQVKTERAKDSAYYAKKIGETNEKLKPLLGKAKGKLSNLTTEEQKQYTDLKDQRDTYTKLRDEKLAEENEAANELLEELS